MNYLRNQMSESRAVKAADHNEWLELAFVSMVLVGLMVALTPVATIL